MKRSAGGAWPCRGMAACVIAAGIAWASAPAWAAEVYRDDERDLRLAVDTTLSFGASLRIEDRNCKLIYTGHGGCNGDPAAINIDDGNLNYHPGDFYSAAAKATVEIELDWRNFGVFVRSTAFYDFLANCAGCPRRTNLASDARYRSSVFEGGVVGAQFLLLDAYLEGDFEVADRPLSLRAGNQLVSWGESLFIQGGINQTNAIDVAKFRVPGSEIKEALVPAPMIRLQSEIVAHLGIDTYYQFYWNRTYVDPVGSYFATSDLVARAAEGLFLPVTNGIVPDPTQPADPGGAGLPANLPLATGAAVGRYAGGRIQT